MRTSALFSTSTLRCCPPRARKALPGAKRYALHAQDWGATGNPSPACPVPQASPAPIGQKATGQGRLQNPPRVNALHQAAESIPDTERVPSLRDRRARAPAATAKTARPAQIGPSARVQAKHAQHCRRRNPRMHPRGMGTQRRAMAPARPAPDQGAQGPPRTATRHLAPGTETSFAGAGAGIRSSARPARAWPKAMVRDVFSSCWDARRRLPPAPPDLYVFVRPARRAELTPCPIHAPATAPFSHPRGTRRQTRRNPSHA